MKKRMMIIAMAAFFILLSCQQSMASTSITRGQAIVLVENTFKAQVSLSEKPRSLEDIFSILKEYVTEEYRSIFLEENLVYVDGNYQTYGSDFARFYIPFFRYNENTKFSLKDGKGYIYEKFDENRDGPVRYRNGYQGVELIETSDGWKVNKILSHEEIQSIVEKEKEKPTTNLEKKDQPIRLSMAISYLFPSFYFLPYYHSSLWFTA